MEKVAVRPLSNAYRLLNPGCLVLVSVGDGAHDNLFPVAWNMPLRKDPPMVCLLSGKGHHSYAFIRDTGEFGLNVAHAGITDAVLGCGTTSGSFGQDKFERFGLTRQAPDRIKAPLVAEAPASLECRVCQVVDMGASSLLIATVLEATAAAEHFCDGRWTFENGLQLIHHMGGADFCISERAVTANKPRT